MVSNEALVHVFNQVTRMYLNTHSSTFRIEDDNLIIDNSYVLFMYIKTIIEELETTS